MSVNTAVVAMTYFSIGIMSKYCRNIGMNINIAVGERHNEASAVVG